MTEEKVCDLIENLTMTIDRTHRHQGKKLLKNDEHGKIS